MKSENILVIGGTGKTGKRIVNLLNELGHNVRVGSRSNRPAFDWHSPEGWPEALQGMDKVYITYQPDLAVPGAFDAIEKLVNEAKKAAIKKLVLLSGKGEREAERCEQVVIGSGLNYTIVRASWFNQNFSENFFFEPILDGFVALPQAEVKIPFVDADDIAAVAVKALLEEEHNGQIYQLTGPEALTFEQAIDIIAKTIKRPITFVPITVEEYAEGMRRAGLTEDFVWLIEYLFTEVLGKPGGSEITNDVEKILGRKAISFDEYAKRTAASGIWEVPVSPVD